MESPPCRDGCDETIRRCRIGGGNANEHCRGVGRAGMAAVLRWSGGPSGAASREVAGLEERSDIALQYQRA
jgi:hypothetical protein